MGSRKCFRKCDLESDYSVPEIHPGVGMLLGVDIERFEIRTGC